MQDQEKLYDEQYPDKDFKKTTYSFTPQEIRNLATFVSLSQMGKIAEVMANNFVSNEVVRRVGAKTTLDSGILYDIGEGKIVIYIPKVVCSKCGIKRAEYSYKNQPYCKGCVDEIQKENVEAPAAVEEVKAEVKKPEAKKKK